MNTDIINEIRRNEAENEANNIIINKYKDCIAKSLISNGNDIFLDKRIEEESKFKKILKKLLKSCI